MVHPRSTSQGNSQGTCLVCDKPLGAGDGQCNPEKRCYEKEGRSEHSVSMEMSEKFGRIVAETEHRSKLAPLLTAVLNYEMAPSTAREHLRDIVLMEAVELFKDDPEANKLRAWCAKEFAEELREKSPS